MADAFTARLQHEKQAAVAELKGKLSTWQKFQNDYKSLEETLKYIPGKVSHDVMVPFGSLAFMPGKLIHTNEILVLLGDNWFADRSASQAIEIVKRRQQSIQDNIDLTNKEIEFFASQLNLSQDLQEKEKQEGIVEIKEELSGEYKGPGKGQRIAHKKATEFAPKKVKEFTAHRLKDDLSNDDKNLFAKLDKLEFEEKMKDEILNDTDLVGETHPIQDTSNGQDEINHSSVSFSHGVDSESSDSDDSDNGQHTSKTIRVNFTKPLPKEKTQASCDVESINTPTDIYNKITHKPKSILKTPSLEEKPSLEQQTDQQTLSGKKEQPSIDTAFSGKIIERTETVKEKSVLPETNNSQPKRVSKFKAQRKR